MRTHLLLFAVVLILSASVRAQFTNGQAADRLLGQISFTIGSSPGSPSQSNLAGPQSVAIDPTTGKLFVADASFYRVKRWAANPASVTNAQVVFGQTDFVVEPSASVFQVSMDYPVGVAVDGAGRLWSVDNLANRILRFDGASAISGVSTVSPTGTTANGSASITSVSSISGVVAGMSISGTGIPASTTVVSASGSTVVISNSATADGTGVSLTISGPPQADGVLGEPDFNTGGSDLTQSRLNSPYGVAVDASGNLYVADQGNNRVLRFNNAAALSNGANADCVLGQPDFTHGASGATSTTMNASTGVAVDNSGTLYVADQLNNRVLRFANAAAKVNGDAADGVIGQTTFTSNSSGSTASTLFQPFGVAVDGAGRLYISDKGNNRIVYFNNPSAITTGTNSADGVLGQSTFGPNGAVASQSGLNGPAGLVVDNPNGTLWVADFGNNRVLRYQSSTVPLPVEVISFVAASANGKVELSWSTATEVNNHGFEVERRTVNSQQSTMNNDRSTVNGWTKIAFVEGHGTSNTAQNYSFTDASARVGKYCYRLKQIDRDGKFEYHQAVELTVGLTPNTVFLDNNYPNPFNPSTKISFAIGTTGRATLKVFNLVGQEVATLADGEFAAGEMQEVTFDASRYSSGIYYYRLNSGGRTEIKKMMLLK